MRQILWFRRDLRVEDNPLLSFEGEVFPIFIFDTKILSKLQKDDKRMGILFSSVQKLKKKLQNIGLDLKIFYGDPVEIFKSLPLDQFDEVVASGDYDEYAKHRDREVSHLLHFRYINDTYLFKPKEVLKSDGSPYLVFTPYYKRCLDILQSKEITQYERVKQTLYQADYDSQISLGSLGFESQEISYDYESKFKNMQTKFKDYKDQRDFLDKDSGSDLSVALRFGLLSIRTLFHLARKNPDGEAFVRQLIFRDFYAYLLFHFPSLAWENHKGRFNGIEDNEKYEKFITAQTGVPIVDAGVRELLETGKMHNRVRMVVASFFTKDLLLPWQLGEKFFAQHLLDYDAASNILSWQWSAGTGIDPQPYFRVFNPYLQSKKFDKEAKYIKKHLPQLQDIAPKHIHNEEYLLKANIEGYPKPMLQHKEAAKIAIEKFKP